MLLWSEIPGNRRASALSPAGAITAGQREPECVDRGCGPWLMRPDLSVAGEPSAHPSWSRPDSGSGSARRVRRRTRRRLHVPGMLVWLARLPHGRLPAGPCLAPAQVGAQGGGKALGAL